MKKSKLKLTLNKKVISNLRVKWIKGGAGNTSDLMAGVCDLDPTSDWGCLDNEDKTMTCVEWSCHNCAEQSEICPTYYPICEPI